MIEDKEIKITKPTKECIEDFNNFTWPDLAKDELKITNEIISHQTKLENIENVLVKYGGYGRTGRIVFKHYAYILVAKELGLDWNELTHNEKIFLKGDMIEQYAGTNKVNTNDFYYKKHKIER